MKHLSAIATVFIVATNPAYAQSSNAAAGANSTASATVGVNSQSGAQAVVVQNAANGVAYSGSYEVRSAPSVGAPGIISANPCMIGYSAGISAIGGGVSFGGGKLDGECNLRAEASALYVVAGKNVAIRHLARDPEMCSTLRGAGIIPAESVCAPKSGGRFGLGSSTTSVSTSNTRGPFATVSGVSAGADH